MKIVIVIFILFTNFVNAEVTDINNRELSNLIEKEIKIIDVRTQNEWKSTGICLLYTSPSPRDDR